MKDIQVSYCVDCTECCIDPHKPNKAKKHNEIPLKRFKTKIDEYLSQDDWLWEEALGIQHKLQQLQTNINRLKKQMMVKVYEKKLAYALQWDTADKIVQSFKIVRDGEFDRLTCANAFRVHQKVSRNRNINEKQVKKLAKEIIDDTKQAVDLIVQSWAKASQPLKGRYQKQEVKQERRRGDDRDRRPVRQEERRRQDRRPARQDSIEEKYKQSAVQFNNSYPTVKIKEISELDTHFNVILKVMKIHKEFRIGPTSKIQFIGGDSTGTAIVVVDLSRIIRVGAVISISNARTYSFHGIKQIQSSGKNSQIKQQRIIINDVDEDFTISQKRGGRNARGRPRNEQREERPYRQERTNQTSRAQRSDRYQRTERLDRTEVQRQRPRRDYRNRYSDNEQEQVEKNEDKQDKNSKSRMADRKQQNIDDRDERRRYRKDQQKPKNIQPKKIEKVPEKSVNKKKLTSSQSQPSQSDKDEEKVEEETKIMKNLSQQKNSNTTKIKDVEPADEDLTIIAEIVTIIKGDTPGIKPEKGHLICLIGDQTAVIRAELPKHSEAVKEGVVVKISNINAVVDTDHRITLKLGDDGICERVQKMKIPKVNINLNLSVQQWQSDQQGEQEEQEEEQQLEKPLIEDF